MAGVTLTAAVLFAVLSLAWRFEIVDAWTLPLPYMPTLEGLEAFWLYVWFVPMLIAIAIVMLFVALLRWMFARPMQWPRMTLLLPIVGCGGVAWLYVPFLFVGIRRVDRVLGTIHMPSSAARNVATCAIASMLLAIALVVVTEMRRTPGELRLTLRTIVATLALLLVHLLWIFSVFPSDEVWWPVRRDPQMLVPLRPCRGALVWRDSGWPHGRLDDLWLHFLDPRLGHRRVRAVSLEGHWRQEYTWLRLGETEGWFVRSDDPAVIRCDGRARTEVVAPARWHDVGASKWLR